MIYVDLMGAEKVLIIYSTNHWYDLWFTEIASENLRIILLADWYDSKDIKLVSITTADDFITSVNEFTNNNVKWDIAYVWHNQWWLSKIWQTKKLKNLIL